MIFDEYDYKLAEEIIKNKDTITIFSFSNNHLVELWGRNYKDKIHIQTLMEIPIYPYGKFCGVYQNNFYFKITPKQAEEIIITLQNILKNRKKKDLKEAEKWEK